MHMHRGVFYFFIYPRAALTNSQKNRYDVVIQEAER